MKTTVNVHEFRQAFKDYGRNSNFTYDGLAALFDYLEQYEEDCGEEIELDVVALCCEYSEHDNAKEAAEQCCFEPDEEDDEDEQEAAAMKYLEDRTQVITFDSGVIIQDY